MKTLDVYCSISNQFRPHKAILDKFVRRKFLEASVSAKLRSFEASKGKYICPSAEVGEPDLFLLYVDHVSSPIGKGSYRELVYALNQLNCPVSIVCANTNCFYTVNTEVSTTGHVIPATGHGPDESDYRNYASLLTYNYYQDSQIVSELRSLLDTATIDGGECSMDERSWHDQVNTDLLLISDI